MNNLDRAVLTTADRLPPGPHDVTAVLRRARRIRRRRTILTAAAAVVTVAALAAVVPQLIPRRDYIVGDPFGGGPIGLWLDREAPPTTQGLPSGTHVPGSSGEITAQLRTVDGRPAVVAAPETAPGLDKGTYLGPAPLPGGGLATIGYGDKDRRVVVVDADGRVTSDHPLPESGSYASRSVPMTGNRTTLFWWHFKEENNSVRPVFARYDIATGGLEEGTPSTAMEGWEVPYFGMQATTARIVEWPAEFGQTCSFEILDITGERLHKFRPAIEGCSDVYYALAPGGDHVAALVTTRAGDKRSQRVVVLDARTGETTKTFETPEMKGETLSGLAWADDTAIRYARGSLGAPDPLVLTFKL
ncbi:hypothetical protein JIG36_01890 [Actinoplanes sp. LDG1-06]|uniref:Uncharacterized protein n=1 Tax=Paractinoplanes ovalisporus TaxID=2810368 RepID=A0ABS2A385_9ACTN|nr:hypothetical protein [Actinoplanes ovalisporus]MBM2614306.1 hypothetical protein [Actinoplanes ovalisporus]